MSALSIFALVALAVFGSQYLVGPFVVWRVQVQQERVHFPPQDWNEVLGGSGPGFATLHHSLRALGYAPCAASALGMSHSAARFVVYRHADGSLAMANHIVTSNGVHDWVEFSTQLAGGVSLTLNNAASPGIYPRWERQRAYALPDWTDIEDLHARFQRLRTRQDLAEEPIAEGRELQDIADWINEQNQWLLAKGFFRRGDDSAQMRLTLPAAIRASYRVLWPLKGHLLAAKRRDALLASEP